VCIGFFFVFLVLVLCSSDWFFSKLGLE
jgi:Ca2+/Na+ antiporter